MFSFSSMSGIKYLISRSNLRGIGFLPPRSLGRRQLSCWKDLGVQALGALGMEQRDWAWVTSPEWPEVLVRTQDAQELRKQTGTGDSAPPSLVVSDLVRRALSIFSEEGKWLTTIFFKNDSHWFLKSHNSEFARASHVRWYLGEHRAIIHCLLPCSTTSVPGSVFCIFKGLHVMSLLGNF